MSREGSKETKSLKWGRYKVQKFKPASSQLGNNHCEVYQLMLQSLKFSPLAGISDLS